MRHHIERSAFSICLALCALSLPLVVDAYDVKVQRNNYYQKKQALAKRVFAVHGITVNEKGLPVDTAGRPVSNADFDKAVTDFKRQDAALKAKFDDGGARDVELKKLLHKAGVDQSSVIEASGSKPGKKDYRGFLGDRDITIKDQAQLEAIIKAAGEGKVKRYRNRVTIEGLDCNIYMDTGVRGVGNIKAGLSDHEVVTDPTPTQQAKKVEKHYRGDVPDDAGKQLEMLQELDKGKYKADQAVREMGGEPVLSDAEVSRAKASKAGQDAETELLLLNKSPEQRKAFLEKKREETARKLKDADGSYDSAREQKIEGFQKEADQAREQARKATESGDTEAAERHNKRADLAEQKKAKLKTRRLVDDMTGKVTERKNPEFSKKVKEDTTIRARRDQDGRATKAKTKPRTTKTKASKGKRNWSLAALLGSIGSGGAAKTGATKAKRGARAQKGLSWVGSIMSVYNSYQTEKAAAKASGREFSWYRMGGNLALDLSGISGAISASEAMHHETTKGTEEYIKQQLKAFKEAGYDTESFKVKAWIAAKAIARGTALGSYQGAKGLPMIGEVISAPENAIMLAEATYGLVQDTRKSKLTIAGNEIQQAETQAEAFRVGKQQLEILKQLAGSIEEQNKVLEQMLAEAEKARQALPKIHAQLVDDQALLAAFSQNATLMKGNADDVLARIRQMITELVAIKKEADSQSRTVGGAIVKLRSQQTTPEAARNLLRAIAKRYDVLNATCDETERRGDVLLELTKPTKAASAVAGARTRTAAIVKDMEKAIAFLDGMSQLASVQQDALPTFKIRRDALIRGMNYFYKENKAKFKMHEAAEFLRVVKAAEVLTVEKGPVDEALETAKGLKGGVTALLRTAQKMPFPPGKAAAQQAVTDRIAEEFQTLQEPAKEADAAMAKLRAQMERLKSAIGDYTAQATKKSKPVQERYNPIPPPKRPIQPRPQPEPPKTQPTKRQPPPPPDYAAMGPQCHAVYVASMNRRFAKYRRTVGGNYQLRVKKPWTWNAARQRFECDIEVWQTAPDKNDDPKIFKPHLTSRLGGAIPAGAAMANIKSGKWFGE